MIKYGYNNNRPRWIVFPMRVGCNRRLSEALTAPCPLQTFGLHSKPAELPTRLLVTSQNFPANPGRQHPITIILRRNFFYVVCKELVV